jgi:hypothetical protein
MKRIIGGPLQEELAARILGTINKEATCLIMESEFLMLQSG